MSFGSHKINKDTCFQDLFALFAERSFFSGSYFAADDIVFVLNIGPGC